MAVQENKLTQKVKDINSLVNSYYIMSESLDMIMREMERQFSSLGKEVKHHVKQRHTEMMRLMRLLKTTQDKFISDYDAFKGDWSKYDELRKSGAYIARIMLLIADRTNTEENVENRIEKYLYRLKPQGVVSNELLGKFQIK